MVKVPAAQPAPRVPRSRRDDRYETGRPAPPKRASAGYVVSIQDSHDTVTVDVLDEELTGVIPLGEMPPVGAIVEVEARGDLLVIPTWFPGPPAEVCVDLPAHNVTVSMEGTPGATVVGGPEALAERDTATYVRMSSAENKWSFRVGYDDSGGGYIPGGGFGLWTPPAGATVTSVRFVAEGYREGSGGHANFPQDDYDNAPTHTNPVISTWPFLVFEMSGLSYHPTVSTFPVDTPGEAVGQGAGLNPELVDMAPVVYMATYPFPIVPMALVVTYLAVRVCYLEGP